MFHLLLAAAAVAEPDIVITASRVPQEESESAASATVIDEKTIERLGDPLASSLLRLTPSAAVETGGPAGTLSQLRIRGAEANHTLLFIDGIKANDPAAGGIPRFELLNADIVSRIEVVRGPQSALWGSDAIGGVVTINGIAPEDFGYGASAEVGSFGFARASASLAHAGESANLAGAVGWQRATGIDSFDGDGDGDGDRDGYRNVSARVRGAWDFAPGFELGVAGLALRGKSQFDGFDPASFLRADTLDNSQNKLSAGRVWVTGGIGKGLSGTLSTSLLDSSNRNFIDETQLNKTGGKRWTLGGQGQYRFATGAIDHIAVVALEHDRETFRARDSIYFGATDQDRDRTHQAITAEWRAELAPAVLDVAVRHDVFSAFEDATTVRASALVTLGRGFSLSGAYAEGIAQPSFFDLYGFFPGSFVGNPGLRPERSRGLEASLRYRRGALETAVTAYRQRLRDEIVDIFDPATFLSSTVNRDTSSRRSGVEVEAGWAIDERIRVIANYAYLDSTEPGASAAARVREVRRPRHSGSIALDGVTGRLIYGASIAYVGARGDTDFDVFPAQKVRLSPYWLAGARVGYSVSEGVELFARASNLLDERYQDVFGYRTEGRAVFAGVRLGGRQSSR